MTIKTHRSTTRDRKFKRPSSTEKEHDEKNAKKMQIAEPERIKKRHKIKRDKTKLKKLETRERERGNSDKEKNKRYKAQNDAEKGNKNERETEETKKKTEKNIRRKNTYWKLKDKPENKK